MQIQAKVKEEKLLALEKLDSTSHGGTSTTGNIVKPMLNTSNRSLLTEGLADTELKSKIDKLILSMAVILAIIDSSRKVKVAEYKEFYRTTSLWVPVPDRDHS